MKRPDIIVGGFFGGIAPYLLGMARDAFGIPSPGDQHFYQNTGYWVGTLLFGLLGACVAYFLEETHRKKAFAMGAAAPGFVLGLMQGSGSGSPLPFSSSPTGQTGVSGIVSQAFASDAPGLSASARRQHDTLWIRLTGVGPAVARYGSVALLLAKVGDESRTARYTAFGRDSIVGVSRTGPLRAYVLVGGVASEPLELPQASSDTLTLAVTVKEQRFKSGLARTLGIRSVQAWNPQIAVTGGHL